MHPTRLTNLPAPAKLNLFLHITGRRENGYHELQTLFQILEYGDKLDIEIIDKPAIIVQPSLKGVPAERNLVYRAASLLQATCHINQGASITLNKRLPMGAGLGGGSSNAATTLLALNLLWRCNLDTRALKELGLQLGADVPLFIEGHTAWAEGIGEILTPVTLPESWFLVLTPDCEVSTAEIFRNQELTRNTSPIKIAAFLEGATRNDCQHVVGRLYPAVRNTLDLLGKYTPCRMTGTGSSVFARFQTKSEAEQVFEKLPSSLKGFVSRGVNESPLIRLLQNTFL
ncbi:MAG: 4-(cytidine 5'-diphospho)-2-C-methyl-D-erythritol kinase [Pseudomonadales bacterium]|nr:4-(cytidine 5'-diphospho)-2-C-methyl-D-erythritol kinase [Pseudomonadales bacterium]